MSAPKGELSSADPVKVASAERQARKLAASLDAAADDLERNDLVPSTEVRRTLLALYAKLNEEEAAG